MGANVGYSYSKTMTADLTIDVLKKPVKLKVINVLLHSVYF